MVSLPCNQLTVRYQPAFRSQLTFRKQLTFWKLALIFSCLTLDLSQAWSELYTLEKIMDQAIKKSYDLEVARIDIETSKINVKEARAAYFPYLRLIMNTEYQKGLDNQLSNVTTVGDQVIPVGTRYQNSVAISTQQTLFDFGIRRRQVQIAKKDVLSKTFQADQHLRDLKIKMVDLYSEALIHYKSLKAHESMLTLAQQLYQMRRRLHEAGTISNVDVATEAILVAQTLDDIEHDRHQLEKALAGISYYTQESYDSTIELTDLPSLDSATSLVFHEAQFPEAKTYTLEIEKKEKEIELLKRQYLPRVSLYSYYNLYGFDPDRWMSAVEDVSQRTFSVGVSVVQPLFDGFKNQAAIERARLEKQKLSLQKKQKLAELRHQGKIYQEEVEGYGVQLKTKATIVNKTQDKLTMVKRLSDEHVLDQAQAIKEHIERIKTQLEAERVLIQRACAALKLKALSGS